MHDATILAAAEFDLNDYAPIRQAYEMTVAGVITEYLYTDKARITGFKGQIKREMIESFTLAFDQGYADGGGDPQEKERDDDAWLTAKMNAEIGYIDQLFQQLKELKDEAKEDPTVLDGEAQRRAEGYARTLDGVYSEGKVRGGKNVMLTFGGEDGDENCNTCKKLKGKRHRAKWWVKRGLTIFRGNQNYECGCWQCWHFLFDDTGKVWTL